MTDHSPSPAPEDLDESGRDESGRDESGRDESGRDEVEVEAPEPTHTGVPAVDDVLAEVDRLDDAPLEEHLPAFEKAHEALRSALDADPGEPA